MAELVSIKRNVDVSPGQAAPAVFHCSQGDVGSKIILGLLNNGTAYAIPSGVTVTIEGSESNGSIFTPISATASGSDITFYLTGEMTAVAGPAICQAVLKSGSNILGTANFTLEVESSPMGADAPPVFTDAGWTWMLNKLNTEFVPALGNETIIDAIDSKADQSDLTALSNAKLDKNQGTANAGKYLKVGANGNVETADLDVTTDKTLSITDKAADAKAVGDELDDLKADFSHVKLAYGKELFDTESMTVRQSSSGWCLTGNGLCTQNSSCSLVKYDVAEGNIIYVNLSKDSDGVYQWQKSTSVPATGTNSSLIGTPVTVATNEYLTVPAGATSLIVSQLTSNTTNEVKRAYPAIARIDKTLTVDGASADAKAVGDELTGLKADLSEVSEEYNYYNPDDSYSIVQKNGNSGDRVTKNNDGSLTCTASLGSNGQRFLSSANSSNVLLAGTYNISCRVTFHESSPSGEKQMTLCVGRVNATFNTVYVMTERGGDTKISGDTKVGWASTSIAVSGEEVFAFECLATSSTYSGISYPYTVDNIQITKGEELKPYSLDLYEANDKTARNLLNNTISYVEALKKSSKVKVILPNASLPSFSNDLKTITFPDTFLYIINDGSKTKYDHSTINAQLPSYTEITDDGLVLSMPSEGVFGFDVINKIFVMQTNFNISENIAPLYIRYYNHCVGELTDWYEFKNINTNINNISANTNNISSIKSILSYKNGLWYTASAARHSYEGLTGGALKFHVGGRLNAKANSYQATPYDWIDIIPSDLTNYFVVNSDNSVDVTLNAYRSLVFNLSTGMLDIINSSTTSHMKEYYLVLLKNGWSAPLGGIFYDEYIDRMTLDMSVNEVGSNEILERTFNASYHTGASDFVTKCTSFSELMLGDTMNDVIAPSDIEAFLFFTDPHLLEFSGWENRCYEMISQIQKYYNSTPTTFCLCGGDWLGNSDLPATACFKMGYIDGFMHSMFDNCYMLVGNHDTNYQGKKDSASETYTTRLSNQSIVDLWYRKGKKAYYKFNGANTAFYCFDTGTEGQQLDTFDNYGYEQAQWFAESLLTDNAEHIALAMHIIYWQYDAEDLTQGIQPLTLLLSQISSAYNNRGSITVNGTVYNYASSTGKVEFMIGGHYHQDTDGVMNGIPWILTTNVRHNTSLGASFDLVFANYDDGEVKLIRVGSGDNRTISLT